MKRWAHTTSWCTVERLISNDRPVSKSGCGKPITYQLWRVMWRIRTITLYFNLWCGINLFIIFLFYSEHHNSLFVVNRPSFIELSDWPRPLPLRILQKQTQYFSHRFEHFYLFIQYFHSTCISAIFSGTELVLLIKGNWVVVVVVVCRLGYFHTCGSASSLNFINISFLLRCSTFWPRTSKSISKIITTNKITFLIALLLPNIWLIRFEAITTMYEENKMTWSCVRFVESRLDVKSLMNFCREDQVWMQAKLCLYIFRKRVCCCPIVHAQ